ncbi:M56 family metallopeptidase [Nakamurella endophytica]|uniref:Peptidase M48 domain-containing protein n=1 Tax=Nakamurella endophytica TaxID=1748367 RepID=A0A917T6F9_9ACTN|nr:M56 family metallopeptidase [Nakamurella endophytica]GGM11988.1 hypothetical protein GCM10011594_34790 [Nakamurella endophytica]
MPTAAALAAALALTSLLLASPVSAALARSTWGWRAPRPALVLWQAVCLSAGVSAVGAGVALAVEPLGDDVGSGVRTWFRNVVDGHPFRGQTPAEIAVGAASSAIALVLFAVLLRSLALTLRRRRAHRALLVLLTDSCPATAVDRADLLAGVRILDHRTAVAYSLPGWHSQVVLSAGLLDLLTRDELAAVISHERAHIRSRHDLLVLPFQAWGSALGRLPGVRQAAVAVGELAEMLADDIAVRGTDPRVLARALAKVALAMSPATSPAGAPATSPAGAPAAPAVVPVGAPPAASSVPGPVVSARVTRLLDRRRPPRWQVAAVYALAVVLLCVPVVLLLQSWR